MSENLSVPEKKKLYVGCSLTHAPQGFVDRVERLKGRLRQDWHVLEFLGLTDGDEVDVYQRDIVENVGGCDAFLGVLDHPSFGLGWEAREAVMLGKPCIGVVNFNTQLTRLALGAPAFHDNFTIHQYQSMEHDVPDIARNWLWPKTLNQ